MVWTGPGNAGVTIRGVSRPRGGFSSTRESIMRNIVRAGAVAVALFGVASVASAASLADMAGKWKWTDFTIECDAGKSCKVAAGPKNVGMEMIQGALAEKDGGWMRRYPCCTYWRKMHTLPYQI